MLKISPNYSELSQIILSLSPKTYKNDSGTKIAVRHRGADLHVRESKYTAIYPKTYKNK